MRQPIDLRLKRVNSFSSEYRTKPKSAVPQVTGQEPYQNEMFYVEQYKGHTHAKK